MTGYQTTQSIAYQTYNALEGLKETVIGSLDNVNFASEGAKTIQDSATNDNFDSYDLEILDDVLLIAMSEIAHLKRELKHAKSELNGIQNRIKYASSWDEFTG